MNAAEQYQRVTIAAQILAGFAANPAVFAPRPDCGWGLCNCTDEDVTGYALHLADKLISVEAKYPPDAGGTKEEV